MTISNPIRLGLCNDRSVPTGPALKVGVATSDLLTVDQHFGSATNIGIYRVTAESVDLVNVARFDEVAHDGNESKLAVKIAALTGCSAVFCQAAGGSAVRQLLAAGVQPIKLDTGTTVDQILALVRQEIQVPTFPWVIKSLRSATDQDDPARFETMEAEGWDG